MLRAFTSLFSGFGGVRVNRITVLTVNTILVCLTVGGRVRPSLLLPLNFNAVLIGLPVDNTVNRSNPVAILFDTNVDANRLFPLLLFVNVNTVVSFNPLLGGP